MHPTTQPEEPERCSFSDLATGDDVPHIRAPVQTQDTPEPRLEAGHQSLLVVVHDAHHLPGPPHSARGASDRSQRYRMNDGGATKTGVDRHGDLHFCPYIVSSM